MGSAFARGLMEHSSDILNRVTVHDINSEKREMLKKLKIDVTSTLSPKIISSSDIIILAVKPQNFPELLLELKKLLQKDVLTKKALIISIAAGISIATIQKVLEDSISSVAVKSSSATISPSALTQRKIVRVMPNTPALIGEGVSGWCATEAVTEDERQMVRQILRALGEEIEIHDESLMDIVTALSGSGPAYTFLFLESLIEGAVELGLDKKTASLLALKTIEGSVKMARTSADDLATLRQRVTSPGGTTEAALQYFEKNDFRDIIKMAVKKAYERGKTLGRHSE